MSPVPDGLILRFPDPLPNHSSLTYETAVQLLLRAVSLAEKQPFSWGYIDQPPDGSIFLVFLTTNVTFVSDGLRYQDADTRYVVPAPSPTGPPPPRELEVFETKNGFIPGGKDTTANRCRKRFRLTKGGHPQLALYYYSRGPAASIIPSLMNTPVRSYPLIKPADANMAIFVVGPRAGEKVTLGTPHRPANQPSGPGGMPPIGAHAQVTAQSRNMDEQERRRLMEQRARGQPIGQPQHMQQAGRPRYKEEDEDEEESEHVSTRSLALTRYKRNHELMDEVFMFAAFGDKAALPEQKPYAILDEMDINSKIEKLEQEVEELQARRNAMKAGRVKPDPMDVSMSSDTAMVA